MNKNYKYYLLTLLLATHIVLSGLYIPVAENLRIQITFVVSMLTAILYPTKVLIFYGIAEDLIAFFLFPSGDFFPGYTLSTVAALLLYRFFLHTQKIDIWHVGCARLSVNLLVNVGLGSLWSAMLYHKGYWYYLGKGIIKNLILFPIEVSIFLVFWKLIYHILRKYHLVKE